VFIRYTSRFVPPGTVGRLATAASALCSPVGHILSHLHFYKCSLVACILVCTQASASFLCSAAVAGSKQQQQQRPGSCALHGGHGRGCYHAQDSSGAQRPPCGPPGKSQASLLWHSLPAATHLLLVPYGFSEVRLSAGSFLEHPPPHLAARICLRTARGVDLATGNRAPL
jgi:hypothetical protein